MRENYSTHGYSSKNNKIKEYGVWSSMKQRCLCSTDKAYHHYGGRGIRVCERWLRFENFLADMGRRPSDDHELDRINNDGNYEPSNCRWATRVEQVRNRRITRRLEYHGLVMTIPEWSESLKYKTTSFCGLLKKYSFDEVVEYRIRKITNTEPSNRPVRYKPGGYYPCGRKKIKI